MTPDVIEISTPVYETIASWRRIIEGRQNGVDARLLLRRAATDLWQVLEIDRTVHPKSHDVARQEAVDALGIMAEGAGVGTDDAQLILAEAFKQQPPPALSEEAAKRVNGHATEGWEQEHPPQGKPSTSSKNRFKLEMLDEIEVAADPHELIEGILPLAGFGITFGPPNSLKSFLLMYLALLIAADRSFCGRKVQGGAVVYVTPEGIRGARRRLIAARRALGVEGRNIPFALVSTMPNLGAGPDDRIALENAIKNGLKERGIAVPVRLIVLDTFRRAMPGKSENEQKDVSIVVDNCEALSGAFSCFVMAAHHSPRSTDARGSGSNATDAATDLMISVIREEGKPRATATVVRYKDGEEGDSWTFELRQLPIGTDCDGKSIVSCYVEVTEEPTRKTRVKAIGEKLSPAQQLVYDIIVNATIEAGVAGAAGEAAPRSMRAITREQLKAYAKASGWWDPDDDHSSRSKLSGRIRELAGKHVIGLTAEHVWPVGRSP